MKKHKLDRLVKEWEKGLANVVKRDPFKTEKEEIEIYDK